MLRHGVDEMKRIVTMTGRENPAEVDIPVRILGQQNSSVSPVHEFRPENRLHSHCSGRLKKANRAIEAVRIGQGEILRSLFLRGLTECS